MAEQRYRFGGPIPESVQKLKSRREYRASSLYTGVKKSRRERFEAEQAATCRKHSCDGCAEIKFIESDSPIRVCSKGADCTSLKSGLEPSPVPAIPAVKSCATRLSEDTL